MVKLKQSLISLALFCKKNFALLFVMALCFILILSYQNLGKLEMSFDFEGLVAKNNSSQLQKNNERFKNAITLIFRKKDDRPMENIDLCILSNFFKNMPKELKPEAVSSLFDISIPYNPEHDRDTLLFKDMIENPCDKTSENNFKNDLLNFSTLSQFSKNDFRDFLFYLDYSKDFSLFKRYLDSKLVNDEEFKNFEAIYEGAPVNRFYIKNILLKDIKVNNSLIIVFFCLFLLFFKKSKTGVIASGIYFLSTGLVCLIILILFPIFHITFNPLSASIFIILTIASIEDFIFILNDYRKTQNIDKTIENLILPCFYTSLTTIIGFGSLLLSDIRDIKYFGLFTAIGALLEWGLMFFFAPRLIEKFISPSDFMPERLTILKQLNALKPKKFLYVSSILLAILSLSSIRYLKSDESLDNIFPKKHEYHVMQDYFKETRNYQRNLYVQLNLAEDRFILPLISEIKKIDNVSNVLSYREIFEDISKDLTQDSKKYLKQRFSYSEAYNRLHIDGKEILVISVPSSHLSSIRDVSQKITDICKRDNECELFGRNIEFAKHSEEVLKTLYESFGASFILVFIFLIILNLKIRKNFSLTIPYTALWGPVMMIGIYACFSVPINFISCIFFAVFLGLSGDNAIQFISQKSDSQKIDHKLLEDLGPASICIGIFTICGSFVIFFSGFQFTSQLGLLFSLGFLINLIGDLYILKGATK